jgi:hypothetical protein
MTAFCGICAPSAAATSARMENAAILMVEMSAMWCGLRLGREGRQVMLGSAK